LIVIFATLFFWLKTGVQIDTLIFANYKIDRLYIKLDKKLTLKADNIVIPKSKAKPSFHNIDKTFDNIKQLLTFFDYIELENIHFNDNRLNILYADKILYITSDDYEIAGNIEREKERLVGDVSLLYLKKENIYLNGTFVYDLKRNELKTKGEFNAYNIRGEFVASKNNNEVDFSLKTDAFSDIKTVIDKFSLKESVRSWIVDKVEAQKYKLILLEGKGEVGENGFKLDFDALRGEMLFKDVKIHYKEGLAPVLAESFILTYQKGGLYFNLKNPTYKGRSLAGSRVAIIDMVGKKPTILKLDLHIKSVIDSTVQEILKAYKLQIPVTQKGSMADIDVQIDIPLKRSSRKISVFVNVDLGKGDVYINQIKLPVVQGNVAFKKGVVTLKNVELNESWYAGSVTGKINVKKQKANLIFDAKHISIGLDKEKFFLLKRQKLPFRLDYRNRVKVTIPKLGFTLINRKRDTLIALSDLKKIKPYLKEKSLIQDGGKLEIITKDFTNYNFKGELYRNSCFFYEKENICYTRVPCSGNITKDGVDFYAFDKRLHFNAKKSRLTLHHLNIDLKAFLSTRAKRQNKMFKSKKLVILGEKSNLRYGKYTLLLDSYDMEIEPNGDIKAIGSFEGDIVKFDRKGREFYLQALRIKDKMLHPLIHFKGLKNGRYSIKKVGDPDKMMKGQIIVEGGVLSDFKAYNNTLAFINTIPALATLSSPGFSQKGFKIKEGVVEYRMIGDKFIFDSIYIKGTSASIVGRGVLNMKSRTLSIDLAIQTARELGKFVGNLPLLGYILMGKDKSLTIGLKITGTLDKPKVETSAAKEILTLPLQIIKRTLESPKHIINQ